MKKAFVTLFGLFAMVFAMPVQAQVSAGNLISCPDFSSVYYLSEDGSRNVFPDEKTYFTWYEDFEDVVEIDCDDMSDIPIGELVEYQAGTQLVTTPSTNEVYAVEPGGVLRQIDDEEMAKDLYGEDWSSRVQDVADTFFIHYDVGEPLSDGELPDGMFISDDDGNLYRISNGEAVEIDDVISETKEALFDQYATELDDMQSALDELGVDLNIKAFASDIMDLFVTEMSDWMSTVSVEEALFENGNDPFAEIDALLGYDDMGEYDEDDYDGDGIKDYWGDHWDEYDVWLEEGEEGDFWEEHYNVWDELEYDLYYNDYWEDFDGEHEYEDWWEDYDEFWDEYDYEGDADYEDYYYYFDDFPDSYEYEEEFEDWKLEHNEGLEEWYEHVDEFWDEDEDVMYHEEGTHEEHWDEDYDDVWIEEQEKDDFWDEDEDVMYFEEDPVHDLEEEYIHDELVPDEWAEYGHSEEHGEDSLVPDEWAEYDYHQEPVEEAVLF